VNNLKNNISRYTFYGIILGLVLRILTIVVQIGLNYIPFTLNSVIELHNNDLSLYFQDAFIPLMFGIMGYAWAVLNNNSKNRFKRELESNKTRFKNINKFIGLLRSKESNFEFSFDDMTDELEDSMIKLKEELSSRKEEEVSRKFEDEQRHWISRGLAEFGAILRENSDDLDKLSNSIISRLIRYIDAKQAGFFIIQEPEGEEKYIEQIALFAYERKKFTDKKIAWGQGLVGACILEKDSIFIENTSEEYVKITSGLGKANPRSIFIVPLKTQEGDVLGAIEIASFKIYEDYERNFVEQVAESIATTITTLKNNIETNKLLEESREQAKELTEHENIMRKTLEEMRDLQLEAAKQSEEFVSFTNSVNHTMIRAEYSKEGILQYANTKFLEILGYDSNSEVEGKNITEFISMKDRLWFNNIWERLVEGGNHFEGDMKHVTKEGKDVWTIATYVSVRDLEGNPEKILFLGIDTTDAKKQSLDYEGQINALIHSSIKAEYLPTGEIIDYNKRLYETLGYTKNEIVNKSIFDFIGDDEVDSFKGIWANIVKGVPFEGQIKRKNIKGEDVWFYGTYSMVKDMYDEISKIIFIGSDTTEQHLMEMQNKKQTRKLQMQEDELKQSKVQLSKKLHESREEMKNQFREIETVKLLHEKTLEGMLDAIVTINQDNNIEFFNKAAEDLWGIPKDEVLGRNVETILSSEHSELDGDYMGVYFKSNIEEVLVSTRKEVYIVDKYGEQSFVLMTLSEAGIGLRYRLTAFIQRIEVELF